MPLRRDWYDRGSTEKGNTGDSPDCVRRNFHMYLPSQFRETDRDRIATLVRDYPLATLVTVDDGAPFVGHVPLLHDPAAGLLLGHLARANPQWRHLAGGQAVLAVFHGPHAYVSPGWYGTPGVPTWNYAVVHARGRARLVEERAAALAILERLTAVHEAGRSHSWRMAPDDPAADRRLAAMWPSRSRSRPSTASSS